MNGLSLMRTLGNVGVKSIAWRAYYEVARKSGWLKRRYPLRALDEWNGFDGASILERVRKAEGFFVAADSPSFRAAYRTSFPELRTGLVERADRIESGEIEYFSKLRHRFDSLPEWDRNPFTGKRVSHSQHWSVLGFYSPHYGDLKFILEPSRFGFLYPLVRAYRYTGDERYPAHFWTLIEDWIDRNPPQSGPLWICGQESALRIIAWSFALYGFSASEQLTRERTDKLVAVIRAHADRVEGTLAYARSQKNNHALSEAIGLWTVGLLFPEIAEAERWREQGRRLLEEEVRQQVYDDGSYIQNSVNYHRLMLHLLLWAIRLGEANNQPLSDETYRRFDLATRFLSQLTDETTGLTPNYGPNDGALLLPLDECDYRDFRPVLQASYYLIHKKHLFARGAWDEDLFWLFGAPAVAPKGAERDAEEIVIQHTPSVSFQTGGYHILRGRHSWGFIRCAHYKDRPAQADQLHFDLWWRGNNIACDAGTYLYNAVPPWDNGLAVTSVHNTVTVDGQDQMTRAGRFLWLDWAKGKLRRRADSQQGRVQYWEGEHNGYRRLKHPVLYRRAIIRIGDDEDVWVVSDELTSHEEHSYRLHWLLPDESNSWDERQGALTIHTPDGPYYAQILASATATDYSLVRGDENSSRGWRSLYYGHKDPALSVAATGEANSISFQTVFSPVPVKVTRNGGQLDLETEHWQSVLHLNNGIDRPLISSIRVAGAIEDRLEIG
jgi:asparagine synthase (glutamine-hydrolysing)